MGCDGWLTGEALTAPTFDPPTCYRCSRPLGSDPRAQHADCLVTLVHDGEDKPALPITLPGPPYGFVER